MIKVYYLLLLHWGSVLELVVGYAIISFLQWTRTPIRYAVLVMVKSAALLTGIADATSVLVMLYVAKGNRLLSKLAAQREKKKERKAQSFSSSFCWLSTTMPVPLTCLAASFDSAVVSTVASSLDTCQVTYLMFSPIVLMSSFVSLITFSFTELSRKRKMEFSGSSSSVMKEEL